MTDNSIICFAGTDPSGEAGLAVDIKTASALGVHAGYVITADVSQNDQHVLSIRYRDQQLIQQDLAVLKNHIKPRAIKIGMIGDIQATQCIIDYGKSLSAPIIFDPVIKSSSGFFLINSEQIAFIQQNMLKNVTCVTPNILEAEILTGLSIRNTDDMMSTAKKILLMGAQAVLIKGGHLSGEFAQDYFTDGDNAFWLTQDRISHDARGTGCCLSTAMAVYIAKGYQLQNAVVRAKAYVSQSLRFAFQHDTRYLIDQPDTENIKDFPWITTTAAAGGARTIFPACHSPLGFYPIVDNVLMLENLLSLGVKTLQLRIKNQDQTVREVAIKRAVHVSSQYENIQLFINDDWQLALQYGAYGVHLGQEDLLTADMALLAVSGIRLGLSTHDDIEFARAHAYRPSYIACGPVYATNTKAMPFAPRGLGELKRVCKLSLYPVVAIGGIDFEKFLDVKMCGVNGIAMISAVSGAPSWKKAAQTGLALWSESHVIA